MSNSDSGEKLRALFLSTIMVLSVVAGVVAVSGTAVAANNSTASGNVNINVRDGAEVYASPGESGVNTTGILVDDLTGDSSPTKIEDIAVNIATNGSVDANDIVKVEVVNASTGTVLASNSTVDTSGGDNFNVSGVDVNVSDGSQYRFAIHVTLNKTLTGGEDDTVNVDPTVKGVAGSKDFSVTDTGTTGPRISLGDTTLATINRNNDRQNINITITTDEAAGVGVNESSVSLNVTGKSSVGTFQSRQIPIVQNGTIVNGVDNGSDFTGQNVTIDVDIALKEDSSGYNVTTFDAKDDGGNVITDNAGIGSNTDLFSGKVDMEGAKYRVIPDEATFTNPDGDAPAEDENATVSVVVQDKFGHNLTVAEGDVNAGANDTSLTSSDGSVQIDGVFDATGENIVTSGTVRPIQGSPLKFNVSDSEAEDVTLKALDTNTGNGQVNSGKGTQTFVASIGGVTLSTNRTTLPANGQARANVTLQLTDGNGSVVEKPGVSVLWSVDNSTDAGYSQHSSTTTSTNDAGEAYLVFTATNTDVTLTVTGFEQKSGSNFNDDVQVDTVAGPIDAGNSYLNISSGSNQDVSSKVNSTLDVAVKLRDGGSNNVTGESVTFSVNNSAVLGSTSVTSDSDGWANTTVRLPTSTGVTQLNVTAGAFNASATHRAQANLTATPENASALEFQTSGRVIPSGESVQVGVQVVDEFGNVNTTDANLPTITLESSDTSVLNVSGSASASNTTTGGVTQFTVNANASSGSATLSATAPNSSGLTNVSDTFSIGSPDGIEVTFNRTTIASTNANAARHEAILRAQLTSSGSAIGISGETITLARTSGKSAKLTDKAAPDYTAVTNASGVATIQINATAKNGSTTFKAVAENYTASGSGSITVTGPVQEISLPTNKSSATTNETVQVNATLVDRAGRQVPRTSNTKVTLSTDLGTFANGKASQQVTISYSSGSQEASTTLNSSSAGTATIDAIGAGVTGQTTVDFTAPTAAPANFSVSNLQVPASVNRTETLTVSANVTNVGGQQGTQVVEFRADADRNGTIETDEAFLNQSVTLNASETTTVSFDITIPATDPLGDVAVGIFTANDSAVQNTTIKQAPGPTLSDARNATEAYKNFSMAQADGYTVVEHAFVNSTAGAMGFHVINPSLMEDGQVNATQPEVLVYTMNESTGQFELMAIEYFVNASKVSGTPSLFGQNFSGPMPGHTPTQPTHFELHAWLYESNPAGTFATWNPAVDRPDLVTFDAQQSDGSTVTVQEIDLPDGGYVVIHNASGAVLGQSSFLGAGKHTNIDVTLDQSISADQTLIAMAHFDDGDQTFEFPGADKPYVWTSGPPSNLSTQAFVDTATINVTTAGQQPTGPAKYAGQNGRVDTSELRTAISDWVSGNISTNVLLNVIDAWVKQTQF